MHVLTWEGKRRFTARTPDGREGRYDATVDHGGDGTAPTPMETVLHALAACAGVDVVSILEKMRQPLDGLRVEVSGERAADHPKVYTRIELVFRITGDVEEAKARRAVQLSADKFCSVSAMLRPGVEITHEIVLEG